MHAKKSITVYGSHTMLNSHLKTKKESKKSNGKEGKRVGRNMGYLGIAIRTGSIVDRNWRIAATMHQARITKLFQLYKVPIVLVSANLIAVTHIDHGFALRRFREYTD